MGRRAGSRLVAGLPVVGGIPIITDMSPTLYVHLLPSLFDPSELMGGVAVVIDILRASTTIVHALAAGAESVIPCLEVDQARAQAANLPQGQAVLGGERGGTLIEGFDFDNSPASYTADRVGGKTVVFTTTNGTRALQRAAQADRVLVGGFVNLNAVMALLLGDASRPVHLVCAGTRGRISGEDCLFAGAVATGLWKASGRPDWSDDSARLVMDAYAARCRTRESFLAALQASQGGRDLIQLGLSADIERAAGWDLFNIVPEFSPQTGRLQAVGPITIEHELLLPPAS